jgi:hypothetical protein
LEFTLDLLTAYTFDTKMIQFSMHAKLLTVSEILNSIPLLGGVKSVHKAVVSLDTLSKPSVVFDWRDGLIEQLYVSKITMS